MTTLFLCTGNLNRSAAAEVISRLTGTPALSAGTSIRAQEGRPMARAMRECFDGAGRELADAHRTRWFGDLDLTGVERIVGFQPSHAAAARSYAPAVPYWSILELFPREGWHKVPDPAFDRAALPDVFRYLVTALT